MNFADFRFGKWLCKGKKKKKKKKKKKHFPSQITVFASFWQNSNIMAFNQANQTKDMETNENSIAFVCILLFKI